MLKPGNRRARGDHPAVENSVIIALFGGDWGFFCDGDEDFAVWFFVEWGLPAFVDLDVDIAVILVLAGFYGGFDGFGGGFVKNLDFGDGFEAVWVDFV